MRPWLAVAAIAGTLAFPRAASALTCTVAFNNGSSGGIDCIDDDGAGHEVRGICKYAAAGLPGTVANISVSGLALTTPTHPVHATQIDCEVYDAAGVLVAAASGQTPTPVATAQQSTTAPWSPAYTLCMRAQGWYQDGDYISVGWLCV